MRQHFPMNLHGKQIGRVLGYIPGSLYGQAVLQGMSRAYQGVLEEANRRIVEDCGVQVAGYGACVLGYDPNYSTFGSSSCGFAGGSSIEGCAPASGVSGFHIKLSPPTPPAFNTPGKAFSLLRMLCRFCDARRSFWAYACGWSHDWRRCGAPNAFKFSYFGYPYSGPDSGSYDPGYFSGDYDSCSDDSGCPSGDYDFCSDNSGKLSIPDGRVKPTTSMELSHLQRQRGRYASSDEQRHWQRQTSSLRTGVSVASVPPLPQLPPPPPEEYTGVPTTPPMPRPAGVESPPPPPPDAMSRSIRFRGVGTWFLSGLRVEGCACSLDGGYSTKWIAYCSFRPFGSKRIVHGKGTPTCNPCSRCCLEGAFGHRTVCCSPDARNMVFGMLESGLPVAGSLVGIFVCIAGVAEYLRKKSFYIAPWWLRKRSTRRRGRISRADRHLLAAFKSSGHFSSISSFQSSPFAPSSGSGTTAGGSPPSLRNLSRVSFSYQSSSPLSGAGMPGSPTQFPSSSQSSWFHSSFWQGQQPVRLEADGAPGCLEGESLLLTGYPGTGTWPACQIVTRLRNARKATGSTSTSSARSRRRASSSKCAACTTS